MVTATDDDAQTAELDLPFLRLVDAVKESRHKLRPWREQYIALWKEYVGDYYGANGNDKANPLNKLEQASTIYLQQLAGNPPRANVFTKNRRYKAGGVKLAAVLNAQLEDFRIHNAIQRSVKNSLFGMGIVKVGLKDVGKENVGGVEVVTSTPFVESILMDDFVVDMTANSLEAAEYIGHKYRVALRDAIKRKDWDVRCREKMREQMNNWVNEEGDARTSSMSGDNDKGQLFRKIEVWEIYVPAERKVITFCEDCSEYPLKVSPWDGPERGPYHALYYNEVDGCVMPLAPAATWIHMHNAINSMMRKLLRQVERSKGLGLAPNMTNSNGGKDATNIMNASDGDVISVESPDAIQERFFGGIDQRTFGFLLQVNQLFSSMAGNLDTLGGLAAGSGTATQDAILNENSSARVNAMRQKVALFTKAVLTDLSYWMWTDPSTIYEAQIDGPPGMAPIQVQLTPEEREYDFFEHQIEVEPFSMVFQSPQQRVTQLQTLMVQFLMPLGQVMQQQGLSIDFREFLRIMSNYMNLPEINDLVTQGGMALNAADSAQQDTPSPPVKVSTENRISKGAGGMQGDESSMIQRLMAGGDKPGRPYTRS